MAVADPTDLPNANLPGNSATLPSSNLPGPVTVDQPIMLPSAPRTPGTSVSSTSFSARMADASLAAKGSALTLSERPSSTSTAMGATTGMKPDRKSVV